MNWSPEKWLAPRHVETPDVATDITKYIDSGFTPSMLNGMEADTRRKLTVLAERLEFIDHLSTLSTYFLKFRRVSISQIPLENGKNQMVETYSIMIDGHEFAGFDFDSDALVVYLLLTCIDTVKGQPRHLNAFKWLKERCSGETLPNWDELSYEYEQEYGLSRRFKEAFTADCSQPLQKVVAGDFAVVKIASQSIKNESAAAWEKRSELERVERIASELYTIRSSFTHASLRSFSPVVPVCNSLNANGSVLLQRVGGRTLRMVLMDIVKYLATDLLIRRGQPVHPADG